MLTSSLPLQTAEVVSQPVRQVEIGSAIDLSLPKVITDSIDVDIHNKVLSSCQKLSIYQQLD